VLGILKLWESHGHKSLVQYHDGWDGLCLHHPPTMSFCERFECEHTCWDPEDGELCLSRVKPEETLVEACRYADVQFKHMVCQPMPQPSHYNILSSSSIKVQISLCDSTFALELYCLIRIYSLKPINLLFGRDLQCAIWHSTTQIPRGRQNFQLQTAGCWADDHHPLRWYDVGCPYAEQLLSCSQSGCQPSVPLQLPLAHSMQKLCHHTRQWAC